MEAQDLMGWRTLIFGRLTCSWEGAQHEWLVKDSTMFKGTVQLWSGAMAKGLLKISRGIWNRRNEILFDPKHKWAVRRRTGWNQRIYQYFDVLNESEWHSRDNRLFLQGWDTVLDFPDETKQQWLASVGKAAERRTHTRTVRRNLGVMNNNTPQGPDGAYMEGLREGG